MGAPLQFYAVGLSLYAVEMGEHNRLAWPKA